MSYNSIDREPGFSVYSMVGKKTQVGREIISASNKPRKSFNIPRRWVTLLTVLALAVPYNGGYAKEVRADESADSSTRGDTFPAEGAEGSKPAEDPSISQDTPTPTPNSIVSETPQVQESCSNAFNLLSPVSVEGTDPRLSNGLNVKSLTGRTFPVPEDVRVKAEVSFSVEKQDLSNPNFQRGVWTFGNGKGGPDLIRYLLGNNVNETVWMQAIGFDRIIEVLRFGDYIARTSRDVALVLESNGNSGMIGAKESGAPGDIEMRPFNSDTSIYAKGRQIASGITSQDNTRTTASKLKIDFCS